MPGKTLDLIGRKQAPTEISLFKSEEVLRRSIIDFDCLDPRAVQM